MSDPGVARVAVYLDFDNIVISRYDQVHGRNQFQRDRSRAAEGSEKALPADVAEKLRQATVDIGAIIDFASSFGTLVLTRAYADWSTPVNADYRGQLVSRAVDLVQLFPAAAYAKNGADIRLAVDAVEDMFRLPDLTHVVIVAGDSDYIALAQRCRRLGRFVVGVGVAGSTSRALTAACDEFVTYDALPGVVPHPVADAPVRTRSSRRRSAAAAEAAVPAEPETVPAALDAEVLEPAAPAKARRPRKVAAPLFAEPIAEPDDPEDRAGRLLERALRLGHEKDDADWLHSSVVKGQMKRMDPSFSERALGYKSFSDFLKSQPDVAELDEKNNARMVRLTPAKAAQ